MQGTNDLVSDNINATMGVVVSNQSTQSADSGFVVKCGSGAAFEVTGRTPDRITKKWTLNLTPKKTNSFQYYILRYKAKGICRDDSKYGIVSLSGKDNSGNLVSVKLIDCTQVINDDRWHVVIGSKQSDFTADTIQIDVGTIDSAGSFAIDSLIFTDRIPQQPQAFVYNSGWDEAKKEHDFVPLNLEQSFNDTYTNAVSRVLQKYAMIVDGGNIIHSERMNVNGVPFEIKIEGNNIITSLEDASLNDQKIDFAGSEVTRKWFFPVGRDDIINIAVDRNASEAFFILITEFPPTTPRYGGIPDVPFFFNDIEMFSVELVYDDGESELEFPYSIADKGYIIRRAAGVYAVPVDENRKLESIVLHNRFFGATVAIAAVTLNTSPNRLISKLVEEPELTRVPMLPKPPFKKAFIKKSGDIINFGNSYYDLAVNCGSGFAIEQLRNRWSTGTGQSLDKTSGLQITIDGKILTGLDFAVENIKIEALRATIQLQSKFESVPLKLTIILMVDDTEQIKIGLSATNTSKDSINPEIKFPFLKDIKIGNIEDNWMFFPQFRNVDTNRDIFNISFNDHTFPMQFYDIYNPKVGIGLGLITHNLNYAPLVYSLGKSKSGVSGFIQHPKDVYIIDPDQTMYYTETSLVFHNGNWRQAAYAYKDWVKTWYNPKRPPARDWFNQITLVKDYFLSETVSWTDLKVPPMFNRKTMEFQFEEYLKTDIEYWGGASPDLIHFYRWFHVDGNQIMKTYGRDDKAYGEYTYDNFGGLEKFKSAISTLQNDRNMPVSLYFVPDRCSSGTEIGKLTGEKSVIIRADGSKLAGSNVYYVCPQEEDWQNFFVETVIKTQRDTNADCVYLDVFGLWHTSICYSKEHGHRKPSWYNQTTHELIKRIRQSLPDNVVLWTEFQLTDINSQFVDGNIAYYHLSLHETFVKSHDPLEGVAGMYSEPPISLYRYMFPDVKQVDINSGNERSVNGIGRFKFIFFNGEAFYSNGWFLLNDRVRKELMIKSIAIKKKYSDCFYSDNITPLIPTERAYVYANKFAGIDKTVYTLYNGRYNTIRGGVLAIEHKEGAKYYDAWNDQFISPQIINGRAIISQKLGPQSLGCIVQYNN